MWSSIPNDIKSSTMFTFKWKLKKHLLHEKDTQLWTFATFHLPRTKFCKFWYFLVLCIFYMYLLFALFLPCAYYILFSMKAHPIVFFCFTLFFSCTSSISFGYFFIFIFCLNILNHTKFLHLNLIYSSVYIGMRFHLYIFFTMFCVCFPNW